MSWKPLCTIRIIGTICILTLGLAAGPARADSHRMETTPTAWWWYHSQSSADIVDRINETGGRLIDLEVQSTEPLRFAAALVHNSGVYAETWWWFFDQTAADLETLLARNQARLIDIERYETELGPRYAAIMVDNSGADAKTWWWYVNATELFLEGVLDDFGARLVDIEAYQDGGAKYAAIMIENSGEDALEWYWYYNEPATTIWNNIAAHGTRLLEYEVRDPVAETFDAILIANEDAANIRWWWYYNVDQTQLNALLSQNGARLTDLDTYLIGDSRRYSAVMVNNSNELTSKMGGLLDYGADGSTGCYLKEVNGPVLASLQPEFVYEPSSSLKVTHHLYAMRQVMDELDTLPSVMIVAEGLSGSCPTGGDPFNVQTLEETLRGMMHFSDNTDTRAVELRYGRTAINTMSAVDVGMTDTSINHTFGCDEPPLNEMTLLDAALLYESVAQGLLLDANTREDFYRLMQSETTPDAQQWWFTTGLENLIHEVATDLGIPSAADDYWAGTRLAWKPGGDTFGWNGLTYRSVSGWVRLPWNCGGPDTQSKEFVFGLFVHGANSIPYADTRLGYAVELFREQVAAGLESCATGTGDPPGPRPALVLKPTRPNPFNPRTVIEFTVSRPQHVNLAVFDLNGRCVSVLADREFTAGGHKLNWDGTDAAGRPLSSGAYLVRLQTPQATEAQKIMLLR